MNFKLQIDLADTRSGSFDWKSKFFRRVIRVPVESTKLYSMTAIEHPLSRGNALGWSMAWALG